MSDQDKIHAIYTALVGNKELGHTGLVDQVKGLRRDVDGLHRFRDNLKGKIALFGTLAGGASAAAWEWLKSRMSGGGGGHSL